MKKHLIFTLAFTITLVIILFIGCGDDDNSAGPERIKYFEPYYPDPEDDTTDVATTLSLSWSCIVPEEDSAMYDVHFGITSEPPLVESDLIDTYYNPELLNLNTKYYWKVITHHSGEDSTIGDLWSFTTWINPHPASPYNPSPYNNASNVDTVITLSWNCSDPDDDPLTYDVYFGTSADPPPVSHNQTETTYTPDTLKSSAVYYWKVIAYDNYEQTTTGELWSFNTREIQPPSTPSKPDPADWTIDLPVTLNLSWRCSDPDRDPLTYDVYCGTESNPSLVSSDQSDKTYELDEMLYDTTYYWKIIARDIMGLETEGPIWRFVTISSNDSLFTLSRGVKVNMLWIPPGEFRMGARDGEQDADDCEYPNHRVVIENGFWMGKYEVTQVQWEVIMDDNPSEFEGMNMPVERISWDEVHVFLEYLNAQEQDSPWRLPSESEWEYACRGGTTTRFPWGDDPAYGQMDDYAWYWNNSNRSSHPVRRKLSNPWGLRDMIGNVWEWCEDWYHGTYNEAPDDGSAWITPTGSFRVLRGGSWHNDPEFCRTANRHKNHPGYRYGDCGFRLVRDQ